MPDVAPLRREDPRRLGEYAIEGLLADSGVYTATAASGDRVAIKVFQSEPGPFLEEIRAVRALDAYYTTQIVDVGVADGSPYIVMEYVEGDTLARTVAERGPLAGTALHRLAIATMTALVAVHQGGGVHGAFGPDNVLLGPDGPRVINTGVAGALQATVTSATEKLESLAYTAPERFAGEPVAAPADIFAWAATTVFAATGRAPFDAGSTSATLNRILRDEPDLEALDEHLRGVVAGCLAKDPAARPAAGEVLLKLVGHSLLTAGPGELAAVTPSPPQAPPQPAAGRPWRFALLAGAAGLAIALAAGGAVYTLRPRPVASAGALPATTAVRTPSLASLSPLPTPSPPPSPTASVRTPGLAMTLRENPADPVRVVAYRSGEKVYARTLGTGTFAAVGGKAKEIAVSPDGTWLALLGTRTVTFVNRTGGAGFTIDVAGRRPAWARDGRRLLLTTGTGKDEDGVPLPKGFAILDIATRKATSVETRDDKRQGRGAYAWLPDGSGVALTYKTAGDYGMRVRDLSGRETRLLHWVGYTGGMRMFSPSGRLFLTNCPSGGTYCLWDTASGGRQASIGLFFSGSEFWGWYDENHLLVLDPSEEPDRLVAMDLRGQERRVVLTFDGKHTDDYQVTLAAR